MHTYGILIARILIAALFLMAGIGKIMTFSGTAAFVGSVGLPAPELLTVLTIIIEIGGALALILGWQTTYAASALILFTLIASFIFHGPGTWAEDQMQQTNFLKNLSIIGGLLYVIAYGAGDMWTLGKRGINTPTKELSQN